MGESLSALYMRDPETAAILRRQAMAQQLARAQNPEIMYRSAASPWVAGLQALAGNLGSMMAERDLGDLSRTRNAEANEFMANALAGVMPGMGQGASTQPQQAPQGAPARMGEAAIPAVSSQPLPPAQAPADLAPIIEEASRETGIPAPLLTAQLRQESNFDPNARGRAGEIGLAQIMPTTARQPGYGVQPVDPARLSDPRENILFGARYLAGRGRAAGVTDWNDPAQQDRALAAYNGGGDPNYVQNVRRWLPQDGSAPAAIPASASAPQDAAPAASPQAPAQAGGLSRERLVMAAMQGINSNNPVVAERARQLLQMAQALPQREGANYSFQNIGGTLYAVDPRNPNNRQALGPAGDGDRTLETVADPTSPTGFRRVERAQAVGQPVAAPSAQVQIDQRGPGAYDQERGKTLAQEEAELRASGSRSRQTMARLATIEQNLDRFRSGATSESRIRFGQIANMLGVPANVLEGMGLDPNSVAAGEQINSVASQMLVGMIGAGGFPAQGFSNADREMLQRALPSLANSPQGNRLIIGVMRAQAQRQAEIADAWNEWRRANGSGAESFDRFQMERIPEIASRDVLAPLLQDAFPANDPGTAQAVVPGPNGGPASPPPPPPPPFLFSEVIHGL